MEYCAVGGEKLAAVRKCKNARNQSRARWVGGFGGAGLAGLVCFNGYALALRGGLVGAWISLESRCVGDCKVFGSALVSVVCRGIIGGYRWCLQRFCKIYAKIANFCATICADRFRSCYLKAVPDCAKCLSLVVCAIAVRQSLKLIGFARGALRGSTELKGLCVRAFIALLGFCAMPTPTRFTP